jgi:hypothetical protein
MGMPKPDPEHGTLIMKLQYFSNAPRMADGAIRADILMTLIDRMIGSGQKKEIAAPSFPYVDERDVFRGPGIELIEVVEGPDRPFLYIADHVAGGRDWLQPEGGESVSHGKRLTEIQGRRRFPPPLTHCEGSLKTD